METPTLGIGRHLAENKRLFVPHHQRDYSWSDDDVAQLMDDIEGAKSDGQAEYFLGLLVFMPKGPRQLTILDGQQRLATITIFLAAIRSWLTARNFSDDAFQIQSTYIASRELGKKELEAKLVLNQNNNDTFSRFVVKEAPVEDIQNHLDSLKRYDSNRQLLEAALYCRGRVVEIASAAGEPEMGARE